MPRQQLRLSDAIDKFLAHRKASGFAVNTIKSNRMVLLRALTAIGNIYVDSIEPRHVDAFFAAQVGRWDSGTVNLAQAHLSLFFTWCRNHQVMRRDADPLANCRPRRIVRQDRLRVPVGEFPRLLDSAVLPRNRMVVALGLFLFLRAGEITTLRVKDVHLDLDEVTVTVWKRGGEVDRMPISTPLRAELVRWLTFYAGQVGTLDGEMFLVPGLRPVPGTYDPVVNRLTNTPAEAKLNPTRQMGKPEQVVQRALDAMGYATFREGIHTLRRSGARALFDELADGGHERAIEVVSAMLHHEQMATTQHYLGLAESKTRRNAVVKGMPMFSGMQQDNVVTLAEFR